MAAERVDMEWRLAVSCENCNKRIILLGDASNGTSVLPLYTLPLPALIVITQVGTIPAYWNGSNSGFLGSCLVRYPELRTSYAGRESDRRSSGTDPSQAH